MQTIKFSHRYKKMPEGVESVASLLVDVALVDYKDLTPEQIEQDTAIVGGGNYQLPKTRLIWLKLRTEVLKDGVLTIPEWGTMRPFSEKKLGYYRGLVGSEVMIEIAKKKPKFI